MKLIKYLFMGLVFILLVNGCTSKKASSEGNNIIEIINSVHSENHINGVGADASDGLSTYSFVLADVIHTGDSQSFSIEDEDCNQDFHVNVFYNNDTSCTQLGFVECNSTTSFTFLSLDCT